MNAKTVYTYTELRKMNTTRLIATYNRIFNTNAYNVFFNPFENRTEMLLELMDEMRLIKAMSLLPDDDRLPEPIKALKVVVSHEGIAIIWNTLEKTNNRKLNDDQIALIRSLRQDGETHKQIAAYLGISQISVFHVLKGAYAAEATRWNTTEDGEQIKPRRKAVKTFEAAKTNEPAFNLIPDAFRPQNAFWAGFGL